MFLECCLPWYAATPALSEDTENGMDKGRNNWVEKNHYFWMLMSKDNLVFYCICVHYFKYTLEEVLKIPQVSPCTHKLKPTLPKTGKNSLRKGL